MARHGTSSNAFHNPASKPAVPAADAGTVASIGATGLRIGNTEPPANDRKEPVRVVCAPTIRPHASATSMRCSEHGCPRAAAATACCCASRHRRTARGARRGRADDGRSALAWIGLGRRSGVPIRSARPVREALHCLENLTIDDAYDSPFDGNSDHTPAVGSAAVAHQRFLPLIYAYARAPTSAQPRTAGDRFMVYPGTCRRLIASDPDTVRRQLATATAIRCASPCPPTQTRAQPSNSMQCSAINSIWRTTSATPLSCAAPTSPVLLPAGGGRGRS